MGLLACSMISPGIRFPALSTHMYNIQHFVLRYSHSDCEMSAILYSELIQ